MLTSQQLPSWTCQGCIFIVALHFKQLLSSQACWQTKSWNMIPRGVQTHTFCPKISRGTDAEPEHHHPPYWTISSHWYFAIQAQGLLYTQFQLYRHGETQKLSSCSGFIKASAKHQQQTSRFTGEQIGFHQVFNNTLGGFPCSWNVANPFKLWKFSHESKDEVLPGPCCPKVENTQKIKRSRHEHVWTTLIECVQKPCKLVEYRRLTYYIHV